jgi:uncharacterized C2H2 Zn-finger protein
MVKCIRCGKMIKEGIWTSFIFHEGGFYHCEKCDRVFENENPAYKKVKKTHNIKEN